MYRREPDGCTQAKLKNRWSCGEYKLESTCNLQRNNSLTSFRRLQTINFRSNFKSQTLYFNDKLARQVIFIQSISQAKTKENVKEVHTFKTQKKPNSRQRAQKANSIEFYDYCVAFAFRRDQRHKKRQQTRKKCIRRQKTRIWDIKRNKS